MVTVWKWLYGLVAAIVGAGSTAVTNMIVDPSDFNLQTGKSKLLMVMGVQALIGAALYLKQSPLPAWDGLERRGTGSQEPTAPVLPPSTDATPVGHVVITPINPEEKKV
jgi:hypothetical protein